MGRVRIVARLSIVGVSVAGIASASASATSATIPIKNFLAIKVKIKKIPAIYKLVITRTKIFFLVTVKIKNFHAICKLVITRTKNFFLVKVKIKKFELVVTTVKKFATVKFVTNENATTKINFRKKCHS